MHRMYLFLLHPFGALWVGGPVGVIHGSREGAAVDPGNGTWMGHHMTRLWEPSRTSGVWFSSQLTTLGVRL